MLKGLKKIFSIPQLKTRILFTLLLLILCRLGAHIPIPGINGELALRAFEEAVGGTQNLFQLMDIFSGGAFAHMTVIALGVTPYISASIILQLLVAVIPSLQREVRETPELGRRKIGKWTRILTILLSIIHASLMAKYALQMEKNLPGLVVPELLNFTIGSVPWVFFLIVICTMSAGTMGLMWIGEQITEKGIGNGMSLIITLGILSSLPSTFGSIFRQLNLESTETGQLSFFSVGFLLLMFIGVVLGTILVIQGERKIHLQYARREGENTQARSQPYIPLKINYAGVVPVIFASTLLMFPSTIAQFWGKDSWVGSMAAYLTSGSWVYTGLYVGLIILITYFWTATQFHPDRIASDMKKNGAFIPGVRQGRPTEHYLEHSMNRLTFVGAWFLAVIAVLPTLVSKFMEVDSHISYFFGGTSLLILVGVVLDTYKQIESHLLMKRYDGFMRLSRLHK